MKRFEILDISGDVGLRAFGKDLEDLFINAGNGLYSLITDTRNIKAVSSINVDVSGSSLEGLMVAWLNELVYFFDTDGFIGSSINLKKLNNNSLTAVIHGEEFDPEKHDRGLLIKAATYHRLKIKKGNSTWIAEIIFDI